MTTVAIMQPYFVPYGGYFRLLEAADRFVLYDCVQFPRRGWVHRNRLSDRNGDLSWLTLPLQKAKREARIEELSFARDRLSDFEADWARFPSLSPGQLDGHPLRAELLDFSGSPVDYIERLLRRCSDVLGIACEWVRSSSLEIDPNLRAEERILAIAESQGAKTYINAPGGRELYRADSFQSRGIELLFLSPWKGSHASIVERIATEEPEDLSSEIREQSEGQA